MANRINKVERVTLGGGLIGALGTNSKVAFQKNMTDMNADGWSLEHIEPLSGGNLFMLLIRVLLLLVTLGLFTLGSSYLLIYEKDR